MFFAMPLLTILCVYVLAAILPAVFLLRFIYRMDTVEKEPPALCWFLALMGVAAALVAMLLETVGQRILDARLSQSDPAYTLALAFLVVAVAEEGAKFFFLYRKTWDSPFFNYRFDGVVYAVCVSLGFAAFENISYVFGYGLSVALPRALLAIPAHMGFAVFMGAAYGRAKVCQVRGDEAGMRRNLWLGYLQAVLLHGFYDACAMKGTAAATLVFVLFVIVMYGVVVRRVKKESAEDRPIDG